MLLVQDQYVQNTRKNFDSDLHQNSSKQTGSDQKNVWKLESGCEEEVITTGNESEEDNLLYPAPSDLPEEIFETRRLFNPKKKNVRFRGPNINYVLNTSETSSFDNEYFGLDCGYLETECRKTLPQDPDGLCHRTKDHFRLVHKAKCRGIPDCGHEKTKAKSNPEKGYLEAITVGDFERIKRKEHRCGHHHDFDFDDTYRKPNQKLYKHGCGGDDLTARCCDHFANEKQNFVKMKPVAAKYGYNDPELNLKIQRKGHHDSQLMSYHTGYFPEEYCDHLCPTKTKKKILEAVQEQQEQFSDSTYRVPCNKLSSQTIPGELSEYPKKRSSEKLTNSSQSDWLYYSQTKKTGGERFHPPRIHKMRSRRTRMNKIKNGWKRAFVQTVRDGSRNERVGVIVMGSRGPEFYSKNSGKTDFIPFRKTKSFLDGPGKSFEVMTVDCKNVFLSSSEPGTRTNYAVNDLVHPEDDEKVEDKIAKFSQNVNEIVKNSEEKFYKSLSASEYPMDKGGKYKGAGEGGDDEKIEEENSRKNSPLHLNLDIPRTPRRPNWKISENSKAMADALNEQAKMYLESQSKLKEKENTFLEELEQIKGRYTPKEMSQEEAEANLSLWGMKLEQLSDRKLKEEDEFRKKNEETKEEKTGKDEISQTGSSERNSPNKQRRKKYYDVETKDEEIGERSTRKPSTEMETPKTPKQTPKVTKWESPTATFDRQQQDFSEGRPNTIPEVFRDLVENGCAISREESENLQSIFNQTARNGETFSNEVMSSSTLSENIDTARETKKSMSPTKREEKEENRENQSEGYTGKEVKKYEGRKQGERHEDFFDELNGKKSSDRSGKRGDGKSKKKVALEDRMKLLRQALPSIAAENEATHLKQLKKYIDRFIDRVETSTTSEFYTRKQSRSKPKDNSSTDGSEIRIDAHKILEFVSNPFKKISSDVTINIAKKLTDALVQDKSGRCLRQLSKGRKHSEIETDEDGFPAGEPSTGSEPHDVSEPTYLKQLKKMRSEHLNNIVLEVKRLSELLRFLDRCNRLHF